MVNKTSNEVISVIRRLHEKEKLSTRKIGICVNKSSATVSYWLRRTSDRYVRQGPALPAVIRRKMTQRHKLISKLVNARERKNGRWQPTFLSAMTIRTELIRRNKITVSKQTVLNDLRSLGFVNRVRSSVCTTDVDDFSTRLKFCKSYFKFDAKRFVFCDEKIFTSNDFTCRTQWVKVGEKPLPRQKKRWPEGRVMVWGAIGHNFKLLIVLPESRKGNDDDGERVPFRLTAETYVRLCLAKLVPHLQSDSKLIFVQDNAGCHAAARTRKYLSSKEVTVADWPPRSPDLNPIERLWAIMQPRVSTAHAPRNRAELARAVRATWDDLSSTTVNQLVTSFKESLKKCQQAGGANVM